MLDPLDEDWSVALAVVAHPDDMEYGAAAAVARWTDQGKSVVYCLVTKGEAGIAGMAPEVVGPLRMAEQHASCDVVGVTDVRFLDHPDGLVEESTALRRDLTAVIRDVRPDVIVSINHRDSWGGPSWNHVDHRAVGRALLDAARDAGNEWIFPDAGQAWDGVRFVAFNASPQASHTVDVTNTIDRGIASLECHRTYLDALADPTDPEAFLRGNAEAAARDTPFDLAATFEIVVV
ncbi:MAG: PIG-L deacetylase family protein [Acidimicrobiales bacterium]|nr:PIG-L deacetylase family protein [Acidimicrobiales bacterium]